MAKTRPTTYVNSLLGNLNLKVPSSQSEERCMDWTTAIHILKNTRLTDNSINQSGALLRNMSRSMLLLLTKMRIGKYMDTIAAESCHSCFANIFENEKPCINDCLQLLANTDFRSVK